jgi:hypothetical protein
VHVVGLDNVYTIRTSKVGCLLHYVIAYLRHNEVDNRPWKSLLDIYHPDPQHAPVVVNTVISTPDDGHRGRPKHVE